MLFCAILFWRMTGRYGKWRQVKKKFSDFIRVIAILTKKNKGHYTNFDLKLHEFSGWY